MAISSDIGDVVLKLQNCRVSETGNNPTWALHESWTLQEALSSCLAPLSSSGLREPTGSFPKNCDRTILPFRSVTPKKRVENLRQLEVNLLHWSESHNNSSKAPKLGETIETNAHVCLNHWIPFVIVISRIYQGYGASIQGDMQDCQEAYRRSPVNQTQSCSFGAGELQ